MNIYSITYEMNRLTKAYTCLFIDLCDLGKRFTTEVMLSKKKKTCRPFSVTSRDFFWMICHNYFENIFGKLTTRLMWNEGLLYHHLWNPKQKDPNRFKNDSGIALLSPAGSPSEISWWAPCGWVLMTLKKNSLRSWKASSLWILLKISSRWILLRKSPYWNRHRNLD